MKRDVAIIGGGPAAIYAAYEFALKYPDIKVVILEEGHAIDFRNCPIICLLYTSRIGATAGSRNCGKAFCGVSF